MKYLVGLVLVILSATIYLTYISLTPDIEAKFYCLDFEDPYWADHETGPLSAEDYFIKTINENDGFVEFSFIRSSSVERTAAPALKSVRWDKGSPKVIIAITLRDQNNKLVDAILEGKIYVISEQPRFRSSIVIYSNEVKQGDYSLRSFKQDLFLITTDIDLSKKD